MMKKAAATAPVSVSNPASEIRTRRTSTMALVIAALFIVGAISTASANPTCIVNCAQCVKIYGDFFDGHSCAQACIRSLFDAHVDCADPTSISKFLKNCAQCVKIYGDFFDGHSCAEACLRSLFDAHVDCADPTTISKFLKYKR